MTRNNVRKWIRKYFWQEQDLQRSQREALEKLKQADISHPSTNSKIISHTDSPTSWHHRLLVKHRRPIAFLIPAAFFHFFWWSAMIKNNSWYLFKDNYFMSLTMVGGSLISGMTSEGGGAVAFPVMTLAFNIAPEIARDFSVMIQSCGMTAASITIILMRIRCEWRVLGLSSIGGIFGLIFGLELIDSLLSAPQKKLGFVSIFFAFASVLFYLIIFQRGPTYKSVQRWTLWKVIAFFITGFIGGLATSLVGNGLDICTFSILTLVFRVSERVATPTSVILMAGNSITAVIWRGAIVREISIEAWQFLAVSAPVVVLGAPLGSVIGSHLHRVVLAMLVVVLDVVALISAFIIIPLSLSLGLAMAAIIVGGICFFGLLAYLGHRLHPMPSHGEIGGEMDEKVTVEYEDEENFVNAKIAAEAEHALGECSKQFREDRDCCAENRNIRTAAGIEKEAAINNNDKDNPENTTSL